MLNSKAIAVLAACGSLLFVAGAPPATAQERGVAKAAAQGRSEKTHKVVMHVPVNTPDTLNQALNNITMVERLYGLDNVQIELVVNGKGLDLFLKDSSYAPRLKSLYMNGNVKYGICAATMASLKLTKADLIQEDYAQNSIVPGGIQRVIELQEAGYVYIRN